jgi:hypothetical protein
MESYMTLGLSLEECSVNQLLEPQVTLRIERARGSFHRFKFWAPGPRRGSFKAKKAQQQNGRIRLTGSF